MSIMMPTKEEFAAILAKHRKWYRGEVGGSCANLSGADLAGADLSGTHLSVANLSGAHLSGANLSGANLSGANLSGAYLFRVNLSCTYLSGADLSGADLSCANLSGAYLFDTDLSGANLSGADLSGADLSGADLSGANLPAFQLPEGILKVYKKVSGKIVTLLIDDNVQRTATPIGRKCRAASALVLDIEGGQPVTTRGLTYRIGEPVYPDAYNNDIRIECTNGIHFFLTRKEAEECAI